MGQEFGKAIRMRVSIKASVLFFQGLLESIPTRPGVLVQIAFKKLLPKEYGCWSSGTKMYPFCKQIVFCAQRVLVHYDGVQNPLLFEIA